ncbi:MAG: DUF4097 family beta strand repeat-containing protein [Gemmatimonadota bacterium]|nr:DUF4097 family beta strand repeat-containing protein [Gemmatimonadota bacterium]
MRRLLLLLPLLAACHGHSASEPTRISRNAPIQAGNWLRVRDLSGNVKIEPATGSNVEIVGVKRWNKGNPDDVRFQVVSSGGDVTVCAVWNDGRCDKNSTSGRRHFFRLPTWGFWRHTNTDVSADFVIRVPDGVKIDVQDVNGDVDVRGATSDVVAKTVNGDVHTSSTGGALRAATVTGNVTAHMDSLSESGGDIRLETVTGNVVAELPAALNAELDARTVTGGLQSDYTLQASGRINPQHVRARIGTGSRHLRISTVTGDVALRRAQPAAAPAAIVAP